MRAAEHDSLFLVTSALYRGFPCYSTKADFLPFQDSVSPNTQSPSSPLLEQTSAAYRTPSVVWNIASLQKVKFHPSAFILDVNLPFSFSKGLRPSPHTYKTKWYLWVREMQIDNSELQLLSMNWYQNNSVPVNF